MYEGNIYDIKLKKIIELKQGNGIIKEYNDNCNLFIFEGEYLNGEIWNGQRKEYNDNGKIIFEGEYLNGKRWNGKGEEKKYYEIGNLKQKQ